MPEAPLTRELQALTELHTLHPHLPAPFWSVGPNRATEDHPVRGQLHPGTAEDLKAWATAFPQHTACVTRLVAGFMHEITFAWFGVPIRIWTVLDEPSQLLFAVVCARDELARAGLV